MDDTKNPKNLNISRFVATQDLRTHPFGENSAAERLYNRTERVCIAVHLLTRHVPEEEPIRNAIRSESIVLLESALGLKDEMRNAGSAAVSRFESSIRQLISWVRILTAVGSVSFQNADILIEALDDLDSFLGSSQRSNFSESISLTREDIVGDTSPLLERPFIKDIKDRRSVKDKVHSAVRNGSSVSDRSEGILAALRSGGSLGIKDIAARLPDFSEKMIQRELASLIQDGKVKKEGFKRWSRYSTV